MNLSEYLQLEKNITESALEGFFSREIQFGLTLDQDYGNYIVSLKELVMRGGKRLRPLFVRMAYQLVNDTDQGWDLALASTYIELIHCFILTHDDIADRDKQRHGGPTLEVMYAQAFKNKFGTQNPHFGTSLGIIGGDLLSVLARKSLTTSGLPTQLILETETLMSEALEKVIAGWHIHFWQNHQPLDQVSVDQYLKGMGFVSASYTVEAPIIIGLNLAQASAQVRKQMQEYAYHVGMAFQIQDDILGIFGDTKHTGKPVGNDFREGKKTLLVLKAYQQATSAQRDLFKKHLGDLNLDLEKVNLLRSIIEETGSLEYSKIQAQSHIQQAIAALEDLTTVNKEVTEKLKELAEFMLARNQ